MTVYQLLFFLIWGCISTVFCIKYIPVPMPIALSAGVGITVFTTLFFHFRGKAERFSTILKILWWGGLISALILHIVLLIKVDRLTIDLDRWSAIQYFWDALLGGEFPYAVQTHIQNGNTPSPLPIWQLTMLPFYLLKDVGILQPTVFILVTAILYRKTDSYSDRVAILFTLILSPAYWYESLTRSDLLSCMILGVCVVAFIRKIGQSNSSKSTIKVILILGLLMSTRAVLAIPAGLVIASISRSNIKKFFTISIGALPIFLLTLLPFLLWNSELFFNNNPLTLHANKSIPGLVPAMLITAVILGFRIRSFQDQMFTAGVLISIITGVSILMLLGEISFSEILFGNRFDITYLSMGMPFLIIGLFKKKVEVSET